MTVTPPLAIARTVAELRRQVRQWRAAGDRIALVPTMGALHAGHLSLVATARGRADRVVVSIFVNPTQFAPHEDFAKYPRRETEDAEALAAASADLLFLPSTAEIYPAGAATTVVVSGVTEPLEGQFRPTHFAGVATIVTKLLNQCQPDIAVFGEKDYQQLQVIRRLARDLDIDTEILGAPTVRETDGLAMSSRNAYLSPGERRAAACLPAQLADLARMLRDGAPVAPSLAQAKATLEAAGFRTVQYLALCDAETLAPLDQLDRPARLLIAAYLGKTRLIDNLAV